LGTLAVLAIVIPLVGAAAFTVAGSWLERWVIDTASLIVSAVVLSFCATLLAHVSSSGHLVYWFGGWKPSGGVALGIDLAVDPLGAGLATLSSALVTCAFIYSFRYFGSVGAMFHVLILLFLAATVGFALSGDIFNMFVLFELMSVSAYALTGLKIEQAGSLQGAVNFAITNSVGGIFILIGIALVYARTGALNLAQIGDVLTHSPVDGLVIFAFALLAVGFLVKAAAVPFHLWLADAYTVAPVPVLILFAGVMSELGIYAIGRIYWSAFEPAFAPNAGGLRAIFVSLGVITALLGGVMCFQQRHVKRMLAFITLGHGGLFLAGMGLLDPSAVGGTAVYVLSDGCIKSALFLCAGVVVHRCRSADVDSLYGSGRDLRLTGAAFALGAFALAGLPPLGSFFAKATIEESASKLGYGWLDAVFVLVVAMTAAAVVRAWAWIFLGIGETIDPVASAEEESSGEADKDEIEAADRRTPLAMTIPLLVLLVAGCVVGAIPAVLDGASSAGEVFAGHSAYVAAVLHDKVSNLGLVAAESPTSSSYVLALISTLGGLAMAAASLFRDRVPTGLRERLGRVTHRPLAALRKVHSGHAGDYVAWLMIGTVVFGAALAGVLV
jgi:multicomponent Na+:H+ antiporter subunit D